METRINIKESQEIDEYIKHRVDCLIEGYFSKATGSNNRNWAKRYSSMMSQWHIIESMPSFSSDFKDGFKMCLSHFHKLETKGEG